jgi:Pentapeptide repeats (8 copies)
MSDQDGAQKSALQKPAQSELKGWREYWIKQGQSWRIEPEIDIWRQKYLDERRNKKRESWQDKYPFEGIKLSRADVEWLLATHENGRGPVIWGDQGQQERRGLNLRGADLREVRLSALPLTKSTLINAHLEGAYLDASHLEETYFLEAFLEGASFIDAHLQGARFYKGHLEGANLTLAHLEGASLMSANLAGAVFFNAFFDNATRLDTVNFYNQERGGAILSDIHWGDANLAVVDWSVLSIMGDERTARISKDEDGKLKSLDRHFSEYQRAIRAYRQLAVVLRNQGINEDAARFAYRAQLMQREVYRRQRKTWQYLGSLFLDLLTGYGYKPMRSFRAYLLVIAAFAIAYFIIGHTAGPSLSPLGSLVFSMTSFHGRGFFPGGIKLDDPLTVVAALEAFIGLLIEVTFIATLTRRLFGS